MLNVGAGLSRIQLPAVPLAGYHARTEPSRGVHDALCARALAIQSNERFITILSLDILYSDAFLTRMIRSACATSSDLVDPATVMVCCSHTHSGPSRIFPESGAFDAAIAEAITGAAASAVKQAFSKLLPCRLYLNAGEAAGVAGQRSNLAAGSAIGQMKQRIAVAEFRSEDKAQSGAPRAVARLVNLACHPTVLGPDNLLVSRDWPGFMTDICEEQMRALGVELAFTVFLNGAAADVSTRYTRRAQSFDEARRLGSLAASAAAQLAATARLSRTSDVCLAREQLSLPRRWPVGEEEALAAMTRAEAHAERLARCGAGAMAVKEARDLAAAWAIVLQRAQNRSDASGWSGSALANKADAEICLAQVGDMALLFLPGEFAHDVGYDLAGAAAEGRSAAEGAAIDREDVWVVGYSNGHLGYVVPEGADTYEQVMSDLDPESMPWIRQAVMTLSSKGMCINRC